MTPQNLLPTITTFPRSCQASWHYHHNDFGFPLQIMDLKLGSTRSNYLPNWVLKDARMSSMALRMSSAIAGVFQIV
jgi:hypothetical protein